jgi:hypothetical protein
MKQLEALRSIAQYSNDTLTFSSLAVTLRTTRFNINKFYVVPTLRLCFVRISEQTATFALYHIKRLDFITEVERLLRGTH